MATGCVWTYKKLLTLIVVCHCRYVCGDRRAPARVETIVTSHGVEDNGAYIHGANLVGGQAARLEVWGTGLLPGLQAALTAVSGRWGDPCGQRITAPLKPDTNALSRAYASFEILPIHTAHIELESAQEVWLCTRDAGLPSAHHVHHRDLHMQPGDRIALHLFKQVDWVHQGNGGRLGFVPATSKPANVLKRPARRRTRSMGGQSTNVTTVSVPPVTSGFTGFNISEGNNISRSEMHEEHLNNKEVERTVTVNGSQVEHEKGNISSSNMEAESTTVRDQIQVTSGLFEESESELNTGVHKELDTVIHKELDTVIHKELDTGIHNLKNTSSESDINVSVQPLNSGVDKDKEVTGVKSIGGVTEESEKVSLPDAEAVHSKGVTSDLVAVTDEEMTQFHHNSGGIPEHQKTNITVLNEELNKTNVVDMLPLEPLQRPPLEELMLGDDPGVGKMTLALSGPRAQNDTRGKADIFGMKIDESAKGIEYDGLVGQLLADSSATLRLFGTGISNESYIMFTAKKGQQGEPCFLDTTKRFKVLNVGDNWATVQVNLPVMGTNQERWYLCVMDNVNATPLHQASVDYLSISSYESLLPLWFKIVLIVLLLILSGLFSGLNLGLMALDKTELKIVSNTGTAVERRYARAIAPVRAHGNFLLCTLLLGNVLVNSSLTIFLDELTSGLWAIVGSTMGIVIFGEIIPQAICSRHGLAVGARTVWLVRLFMVLTGPLSYPISKVLDVVLGEEIGNTYDRERLKELIKVTHDYNDLEKEEQNIICGALELRKKTVSEVMTKLDDVFMLSVDTCLDFNTINDIMQQGYSRIPIYENERTNIISVLFIKDLAFIDPDDNTPLKTVSQFYKNPCNFVFEDTTLDIMFREFKEGDKGHMAFVQRVNSEGDGDPYYEVMGLITLEDVIEELIQEEIVDETDVFTDNKTKRKRHLIGRRDFTEFSQATGNNLPNNKKVQISSQMQVAAFQYLRTSVEPFKEGQLSESIVKKLIKQDIIHVIKLHNKEPGKIHPNTYIYTQGKVVDYFVLILEGHVEVTVGRECLTFESGPFTYFGLPALNNTAIGESPSASTQLSRGSVLGSLQSLDSSKFSFIPDYSVRGVSEVVYMKIKRSQYIAARRAFLLEQSQREPHAEEHFELEIAKGYDNLANGMAAPQDRFEDIELAIQNMVNSNDPVMSRYLTTAKASASAPSTPSSTYSSTHSLKQCSSSENQDNKQSAALQDANTLAESQNNSNSVTTSSNKIDTHDGASTTVKPTTIDKPEDQARLAMGRVANLPTGWHTELEDDGHQHKDDHKKFAS
ncbi:metal transporter uex isoform X2 [Oratosquilla oratoria]|uniref:metal transporter uex isoform X2 n=1 Tax=Oratosquilla oratoria TaxID=337810 RepID=UPI003F758297